MKKSLVMIIPLSEMQSANALLQSIGWPDDNFKIPLVADGATDASHFGLRASVDTEFIAVLTQRLSEQPKLAASLIVDQRDDQDRQGHFADTIAAEGVHFLPIEVA